MNLQTPPNVLTIAGSDSGGGAGIQADIKTMSALGVYSTSVITSVTAQNTCRVAAIHPVPAPIVTAQLNSVFEDFEINTVKIGMLGESGVIDVVADMLEHFGPLPIVLDPVMVATSGDRLINSKAIDKLKSRLFPLATLLTPNLPEAAALLNEQEASTLEEMKHQALALRALGAKDILLKGGHHKGSDCIDLLLSNQVFHVFKNTKIDTQNTHGTGCTLSSAISAKLALGQTLEQSVAESITYVRSAIRASDSLNAGKGHGPLHHFFASWA